MKTLKDLFTNGDVGNYGTPDIRVIIDNMEIFDKYLDTPINELDYDALREELEDYISSASIIGYGRAMSFLVDNDISLKDSLCLADDLGYQVRDLSSELLASLLYSDMLRDILYKVVNDIEAAVDRY